MNKFSVDDIKRGLTDEARFAISDLILAWASFDTTVSFWLLHAFGMPMDTGSILLGNMDTKTKLERLKLAFAHHGNNSSAASIARLSKAHQHFVEVRNAITHRQCVGMLKSDSTRLVFTSTKRVQGAVGHFEILGIDLSEVRAATSFAEEAVKSIFEVIDAAPKPPQQQA